MAFCMRFNAMLPLASTTNITYGNKVPKELIKRLSAVTHEKGTRCHAIEMAFTDHPIAMQQNLEHFMTFSFNLVPFSYFNNYLRAHESLVSRQAQEIARSGARA